MKGHTGLRLTREKNHYLKKGGSRSMIAEIEGQVVIRSKSAR